jgi:hypothetical protein
VPVFALPLYLETLDLSGTFHDHDFLAISGAIKRHRCTGTCIVKLFRSNTRDETIWNQLILPYLQTRTYLQLVLKIKVVAEEHRRSKLFGRALDSVQIKPYIL